MKLERKKLNRPVNLLQKKPKKGMKPLKELLIKALKKLRKLQD